MSDLPLLPLAAYLRTLDQPLQHSPELQQALERNRRSLLCSPLLFQPHEISGWVKTTAQGHELWLSLRNEAEDRKRKCPRPPLNIQGTFAEWRSQFKETPRLLLKLTPLLQRLAPELLAEL